MAAFQWVVVSVALFFSQSSADTCKAKTSRPENDPYCQVDVPPFCPKGRAPNTVPTLPSGDMLHVYALKAPLWEDQIGDEMNKYHLMQDAVGFHHVQSGANFTLERSGLGDLFHCTFPHELSNGTLVWCNQGATCLSMGIDEKHWAENGTLVKVAEINGTIFNQFAAWVEKDNATNVVYETWTVFNKKDGKMLFDSCDSSSWVQAAFATMAQNGATFDQSVRLNYTRISIYADRYDMLGTAADIAAKHKIIFNEMKDFYRRFKYDKSVQNMLTNVYNALKSDAVSILKRFYLFYNEEYYQLHISKPFFSITYDEAPLPKI